MTPSGQCRLSPMVPWTYDTSRIMEIIGKMLRILHRALPWDTLDGHRQRFVSLYNELRKVYEKLSNIQYFRGIIQV
jgi:huntingtin interacting protein 1